MPVGVNPSGIAIAPDGTKVYVVNQGTFDIPGNTVSVINTSTNTFHSNSTYFTRIFCIFHQAFDFFVGNVTVLSQKSSMDPINPINSSKSIGLTIYALA